MSIPVNRDGCDALREAIALSGPLADEDCTYPANSWRGMIERGLCAKTTQCTGKYRQLVQCSQADVKILLMPRTHMPTVKAQNITNEDIFLLVGKIVIEVRPRDKSGEILRLTMRLSEGAAFFADGFPTTETYEAFCRKVRDRKAHPPAKVPIPCEGGKSLTAQGQTKKPGSHSQDKHK